MGRGKHLVFDIHGVLVGRTEPPGHARAGEVIERLRARGHRLYFLTNASSALPSEISAVLGRAGILAHEAEIYTAAMAVARFLCASGGSYRLQVIGSPALRWVLESHCPGRVSLAGSGAADTLVVSRSHDLDDEVLERLAARPPARFLATSRDMQFRDQDGVAVGPGVTVSRVERALGRPAQVLGKPNPAVLTDLLGIPAGELRSTLVVGDSIEQDVALARGAGAQALLLPDKADTETAALARAQGVETMEALDELLLGRHP